MNQGRIEIQNGYTFLWMRGEGQYPEIYGSVESPSGTLIKGSSGWYRTNDEQKAAKIASALYATA